MKERKTNVITFRVTPRIDREITETSTKLGMSKSDYLSAIASKEKSRIDKFYKRRVNSILVDMNYQLDILKNDIINTPGKMIDKSYVLMRLDQATKERDKLWY